MSRTGHAQSLYSCEGSEPEQVRHRHLESLQANEAANGVNQHHFFPANICKYLFYS